MLEMIANFYGLIIAVLYQEEVTVMGATHLNQIIVWAVDPFSGSIKLQKQAGLAIQALLNHRKNVEVQPVYSVVNPLPSLPKLFTREIFETLQEKARIEFDRVSLGINLRDLSPLVVVKSKSKNVDDRVDAVLKHARSINAQMVVVSTRASTGPNRWFLGSFAETMSLKSKLALLTVNPSWSSSDAKSEKMHGQFKSILFPTDFSEESHSVFFKVINFAKEMGSRIHVYHKFNPFLAFNWDIPITSTQMHVDWATEERLALESKARKWKEESITQGVLCTWEVDAKNKDSVLKSILKKSKKLNYLIAVTSKSGPIETNFLGSVTRQLIRESTAPVMIIHPDARKARKPKTRDRLRSKTSQRNQAPVNYGNDEHSNLVI